LWRLRRYLTRVAAHTHTKSEECYHARHCLVLATSDHGCSIYVQSTSTHRHHQHQQPYSQHERVNTHTAHCLSSLSSLFLLFFFFFSTTLLNALVRVGSGVDFHGALLLIATARPCPQANFLDPVGSLHHSALLSLTLPLSLTTTSRRRAVYRAL
jgi:hypothetical protein